MAAYGTVQPLTQSRQQSAQEQSEDFEHWAVEEATLWPKECCPIISFLSLSRCPWEWNCCPFCGSTNLITERESRWERFIWTLTPPFLHPSPSPQRATCTLHNRLSQNKQHIYAARRIMACHSHNESSSMTPWKLGLVVHHAPAAWTPTLLLIDRR